MFDFVIRSCRTQNLGYLVETELDPFIIDQRKCSSRVCFYIAVGIKSRE
jgi:hypothetical protein